MFTVIAGDEKARSLRLKWYQAVRPAKEVQTPCERATCYFICTLPSWLNYAPALMVCQNTCIQSECYCPLFTPHVLPGFQTFVDQRQSSLRFLSLVVIECSHILEEHTAFIIPGDLTGSTWTLYNHISTFTFNNHVNLIHSTPKMVRMFLSNARTFTHYNNHNPQRITFHISFIFHTNPLLGAFAKFRKATISCVMSMSVCPTTRNNSAPTGRIFVNFNMSIFPIYLEKISVSLKSDKKTGYFTRRPILLECRMFQTTVAKEIKIHILCSLTFFPKIVPLMR
jgi:hypothetical protein